MYKIDLKKVARSDCQFLYELLAERDPIANISHKKMPRFEEHVKFVMSKPYSKWYIIFGNKEKIGSIYLTKNDEVGIFIKNGMHGKGIGKKALYLLMKYEPRKCYRANINPKNIKSIDFFKKEGFKLIQYVYELRIDG